MYFNIVFGLKVFMDARRLVTPKEGDRYPLGPPNISIVMENLNPYPKETFEKFFKQTSTFDLLQQKYNYISFDKFFERNRYYNTHLTPRHQMSMSRVSAVPFYYLQYLDHSVQIVDLGCGMNFFKPYFKDLYGIGAEKHPDDFFADEHAVVVDAFYQNHIDTYTSVFSINALHFHPLETLQNICLNFSNMLKSGGRGFLALNIKRMLEQSTSFDKWSNQQLDHWIRSQFVEFPHKIIVFDLDLSMKDAWMDGNIRIVFEK